MKKKRGSLLVVLLMAAACGVKGPPEPPIVNEANAAQHARPPEAPQTDVEKAPATPMAPKTKAAPAKKKAQ